jgi:hypothetical protein
LIKKAALDAAKRMRTGISILARRKTPKPDALKQTDRSALSIKTLPDGRH